MKKKTLIVTTIFILCCSQFLSAQPRIGVKGGYSHSGFNAGVAVCFNMPLGFAIQPELQYVNDIGSGIQYVELPVGLQCGLDLILLRPFLAVTPYLAYPFVTKVESGHLDYGVGVGGGLDIWRFQINAQYKWSLADVVPKYEKGFEISLAFFF